MELKNCSKCGRVFAYNGIDVCSRCSSNDEEDFKKVKEYLYDHPGATVSEVSEETGVTEKQILRYLRESRIEIREADNCLLDCERCGKAIRSGRFCDECVISMKKDFNTIMKPKTAEKKVVEKTGTRMYIADRRKK